MAGFMYKGLCHTRQQDAIDNYFQSIPLNVLASSSNSIFTYYNKNTTGTWSLVKYTVSNTGVTNINYNFVVSSPIFATCDESVGANDLISLTAAQGALIGGSIILVWAIAFTIRAVISSLNSNEREYENE